MDMVTDRERLHELLDSLPEDCIAQAEMGLTALAMPDAEAVVNADREALATAEQDPEKIGHALAGYRKRQGWTHEDLAAFLGLTLRQLAALSVERRPLTRRKQGTWSPGSAIYALGRSARGGRPSALRGGRGPAR
jgi:hypothetical protein